MRLVLKYFPRWTTSLGSKPKTNPRTVHNFFHLREGGGRGSHLLAPIRSKSNTQSPLIMQKSTGSDLIPEEQIQAIVSKVESNTEILKGVYLL